MLWSGWTSSAVFILAALAHGAVALRLLLRRRPHGETMAWLTLILAVPFVGISLYLMIGESRLLRRRSEKELIKRPAFVQLLTRHREGRKSPSPTLKPAEKRLEAHARALTGIDCQAGNELDLIEDPLEFLRALAHDIDSATRSVHLQFFIFNTTMLAAEVCAALERAAARGVSCRILVDAVGSRDFLEGPDRARLEHAGVRVMGALPVGVFRMFVARADLRQHRKTVVIDGRTGYTGSQNMVDPRDFKATAGVGQWVDAMVRVRGPVVDAMEIMFLMDWEMDCGEDCSPLLEAIAADPAPPVGHATVQVIPSGPGATAGEFAKVLVAAIFAAEREVVLTTPYFVPDQLLKSSLEAAARRGVRVRLTVPKRTDSHLVNGACRALMSDLRQAGVEVHLFDDGLLHTKAVTIDREFSFFGTANLDMRSFWLNFELMLAIYHDGATMRVLAMQEAYERRAVKLGGDIPRRFVGRIYDSVACLFTPVL